MRSAAAAVGAKISSAALPGLSRKVVSLSQEPGHLLLNLPAYVAGMHARLSYKRAGHGNYSVSTLVDAGRRLTSLEFIVFTTLFRDVMQRMIAPWALLIQSSGIEPWALQHRRAKQDKLEKCFMANLHYFREFLRILVLLRQHVGSKDLNSFVRACLFLQILGTYSW